MASRYEERMRAAMDQPQARYRPDGSRVPVTEDQKKARRLKVPKFRSRR